MKSTKILSILLSFLLLAIPACVPAVPLAAMSTPIGSGAKVLTVLAAASLSESFTELGKLFETRHPGVKVSLSFAGSQQLAQQISQGLEADVFASASPKNMDSAVQSQRINQAEVQTFVKNRLVVIFPKGNPAGLQALKDLAKPGVKLDVADKSVPVGQYALDFLEKALRDPDFGPGFKEGVLKNVISYEENVKSVFTKVALDEADAGIVYVTDITANAAGSVGQLEIPDGLNTIATYPIAPLADSKNPEFSKAFVALVLSPEGQELLARYGFIPAAAAGQ